MKKLHLISNAHIDPVWQWSVEEGFAAALATFRSAVNLAKEFDYIFCHNEAFLYEMVEQYDHSLFEAIQALVKQGKWHIMGGWYLQPDCVIPCGESLVRQIKEGAEYFEEKFGKTTNVAVNVDCFGHSVGLVQILKKCGQDGYVFVRPWVSQIALPDEQFIWRGVDGSEVRATRIDAYASLMGEAVKKINRTLLPFEKNEHNAEMAFWGLGNHGGGPSRKDLQDITKLQNETKSMEVVHSTPENFFENFQSKIVFDKSLLISMPGCYTSMADLKSKYAEVERLYFQTEKILSVASINEGMEYNEKELRSALRDILTVQFHDILSGCCVQSGKEYALSLLGHAETILRSLRAKAFFTMLQNDKKGACGEYPIEVFNYLPYESEELIECEFTLVDNCPVGTHSEITVRDVDGNIVPSQIVKEESNIGLDWRKKITFKAKLQPLSLNRFNATVEIKDGMKTTADIQGDIVYSTVNKSIKIGRESGLIESYVVDGKEYINGFAFQPFLYSDNADPWGMSEEQQKRMGTDPQPFSLSTDSDYFKGVEKVQIIENGEIILRVEAFFVLRENKLQIVYQIDKKTLDVSILVRVYSSEQDKMLKLHIPTTMSKAKCVGQTAYGSYDLFVDGRENVAHRFIALKENHDSCLAIFNKNSYGSSYENGQLSLSLLRMSAYCAHPMEGVPLLPNDRFTKRMEQGEREFQFMLSVCGVDELEKRASAYVDTPYALNAFPSGENNTSNIRIYIENSNITMPVFKKSRSGNAYIFRLFNNTEKDAETLFVFGQREIYLRFGKHEVKTVVYDGTCLTETDEMLV